MKQTQWYSSKGNSLPSNDTYKTKTSAGNTLHFIRGNENVTHSAQGETVFLGGLFRISEYTQRERKCSFRKLQIFISQTTDSHFANYRFSFRKLQISISQTTDFHFVSSHFVSQTTVSPSLPVILTENDFPGANFEGRKPAELKNCGFYFGCKGVNSLHV